MLIIIYNLSYNIHEFIHHRWVHFSRLPILPEIDALKEDLSIINDTFKHLEVNNTNNEKNYVEAYKYSFSRKG